MTNDELIRQVATEIKRNHHSGTMEEALDAAKAVLEVIYVSDRTQMYRDMMLGQMGSQLNLISAIADPSPNWDIQGMVNSLVSILNAERSILDDEDYTLLSTEPQIVTEIIEPEAKG